MKRLMMSTLILAFGLSGAIPGSATAVAAEISGVSLPDTARVADQELVLNGMGMRKRAWIEVYVGALYLPSKIDKAAEAIEANGPSRMVMRFMRDVPADKVVDGWKDGFANNNSKELQSAIADRLDTFNGFFTEDLKEGDLVIMDYVPNDGTSVRINDDHKGTIEGADFATALRAVWLGPKPPSKALRDGLLGGK